jgi:hypothetical protein
MVSGYNFGAPAIDFSPLGRLGDRYAVGLKRRHDQEIAQKRDEALAGFGQNGDLAALGKTLLQAGDLEGGMSALRIAAANEGTPWQKQQAAQEQARFEQTRADTQAERDRLAAARQRDDARLAPHSERKTQAGEDKYGNPTLREYWQHPDGSVTWIDTGETVRPPKIGPQSGGAGDPNLPAPMSIAALSPLGLAEEGDDIPPRPNNGYVIPGTLEGYPMGTVRLPKPPAIAPSQGRAAVAAPPAVAPPTPAPNAPAQGAQPQQAPLPAPAGQVAVAAPATPNAAPIQRRANVDDPLEPENAPFVRVPPPNVNKKEWVTGETKRLAAMAGGGEKLTKEQTDARAAAGKMEGAEKVFRPNEGETISVTERLKSVIAPGNSENFITSTGYQKGVAAKKEWIAGLLRKESGAAVTPDEFTYYNDIYFPAVGQGGEVAAQKAQARERALLGVRAGMTAQQIVELDRTGGGMPPSPGQGAPAAPAGPAGPAIPENAKTAPNGIRFW